MSVKRFDPQWTTKCMYENGIGEYARFTDHEAELKRLHYRCIEELDKSRAQAEQLVGELDKYKESYKAQIEENASFSRTIIELREELAKYRLRWTEEKPTVEGWYWIQMTPNQKPYLTFVQAGAMFDFPHAKWAGPIPQPEG